MGLPVKKYTKNDRYKNAGPAAGVDVVTCCVKDTEATFDERKERERERRKVRAK